MSGFKVCVSIYYLYVYDQIQSFDTQLTLQNDLH